MQSDETAKKGLTSLSQQIEGVLNDYATGIIDQQEAISILMDQRMNAVLSKLHNLCSIVKKVRDQQKLYFETKNSKVLTESKRLENDLDKKIEIFFQLEQKRQNPEIPLKNSKQNKS